MKTILFLLCQGFLILKETSADGPLSQMQLCSRKDPNLNECVRQAGQIFIPLMAAGISEWNIDPIDPMTTAEITFQNTNDGNSFNIEYKNIVQTGFSAVIIENADVDLEHKVMTFKLKYPYITFTADYVGKGKFLDFALDGSGKANISVWNAYSSFVLKYHVENDHIKQDSVIFGFSFDKIYLDYPNLTVNGDEELSKSAGAFLNDNANVIIDGFKPELEKFYSEIIGKCLDGFFTAVPYSTLFKNS